MQWSTEERLRLLGKLDGVDRVLTAAYRLLMALIIAAIVAAAVAVVLTRPWGAGHQGEWFYFSCIVLLALGWAVKEFVKASRRYDDLKLPLSIRSSNDGGAKTWELRWGPAVVKAGHEGVALPFGIQLKGLWRGAIPPAERPHDMLPDENALHLIKEEMGRGAKLDEAILAIQPAFAEWSALEQRAYLQCIASLLDG